MSGGTNPRHVNAYAQAARELHDDRDTLVQAQRPITGADPEFALAHPVRRHASRSRSATTSAGTKSIGQAGIERDHRHDAREQALPRPGCRPWNAAISPVPESPMTTDGLMMTCRTQLDRTTSSAADFDEA